MKKTIILLIATVGIASAASAQFRWGVKLGSNVSTFGYVPSGDDTKMKTGFYGGLALEYKFTPMVGLGCDLYYSRQGASNVEKSDGNVTRTKLRQNYFNLPVMFRVYPLRRLSFEIGPQIGLAFNSDRFVKLSTDNPVIDDSDKAIAKTRMKLKSSTYNAFDYGIVAGASYRIISSLWFNARYYYGLADCFKVDQVQTMNRNRVIQLGFTLGF